MITIAFGHRKRVGKDTACKFLLRHLRSEGHEHVARASFAWSLKEACQGIFGWAGLQGPAFYEKAENAHLREEILPAIGKTPRQVWIEVGNHMREVYEHVWVDSVIQKYADYDVLLISDLRYPNEIYRINGFTVKINNPNAPVSNDVADCALQAYDDWDFIIENDGSLGDLNRKVIELWNKIPKT